MVKAPHLRPDEGLARKEARPAEQGRRHHRFGWVGLGVGAAAWAASTQAGLSLVPVACATATRWPALASALLAAATLAGLVGSWAVLRRAGGLARFRQGPDGQPGLFLALLGLGAGVLFLLAILSQLGAGLVLSGCER
ncbi:hypothetical protein [uncultured Alsobacter sp.]|uniref:hypothetical protein n=1 Tax=uncultured Alsobacter sp. TaxID=1748258 RepID=UPI0025D35051|nr:hypothetical protein [uncultured Alsobacter sp.]